MKFSRSGQAEPLTQIQFKRLLDQFHSPKHRLIFAIAWYTAERPISILRLTVDQIYTNPAQSIPREKLLLFGSQRKDRKTREVPLHTALKWELKAYRPPMTGFLFPGSQSEAHLSWSAYDKALRRVLSINGLRGFSTYSTRRGALTEMARGGCSLRVMQAFSGHSDLACLQRYIEVTPQEVERAITLL